MTVPTSRVWQCTSNRRTVGLDEIVMGQWEQERSLAALEAAGFKGGRHAPLSMGLGESEVSPLVRNRLDAVFRAKARGMQRESAASPLPRYATGMRPCLVAHLAISVSDASLPELLLNRLQLRPAKPAAMLPPFVVTPMDFLQSPITEAGACQNPENDEGLLF
jgi:hypothetical protein